MIPDHDQQFDERERPSERLHNVRVAWANLFARGVWLSKATGKRVRLPMPPIRDFRCAITEPPHD